MWYRVYIEKRVSTSLDIEADSPAEALAQLPDHELGSIVNGAFGSHDVVEAGEWEALEVSDENRNIVWTGP